MSTFVTLAGGFQTWNFGRNRDWNLSFGLSLLKEVKKFKRNEKGARGSFENKERSRNAFPMFWNWTRQERNPKNLQNPKGTHASSSVSFFYFFCFKAKEKRRKIAILNNFEYFQRKQKFSVITEEIEIIKENVIFKVPNKLN